MKNGEKEYILCFALINKKGKRSMPIAGKTITIKEVNLEDQKAKDLILEILLRIVQSPESKITNNKMDPNIYVIRIMEESMKKNLPRLKSNWIESGDKTKLIQKINIISKKTLTVNYEKYIGIELKAFKDQTNGN